MDRQAEIRELDSSLSAMTDLLLSESDEDFEIEGEFAAVGVPGARRRASGATPASEAATGGGSDAVEQIEQVQAAVAEALRSAASELGGASEGADAEAGTPAGPDGAGGLGPDADAEDEAGPVASGASNATPGAGDEPPTEDVDAVMKAVSAELDGQGAVTEAGDGVVGKECPGGDAEMPAEATAAPDGARADEDDTEGDDADARPGEAGPEAGTEPDGFEAEETAGPQEPASVGGVPEPPARDKPMETGEAPTKDNHLVEVPAGRGTPAASGVSMDGAGRSGAIGGKASAIAGALAMRASVKLGDVVALVVEPVATRLAGQSKVIRQSLAWLALWTAFNAGVVWGYLLLFRSPGGGAHPASMTRIAGSEGAGGDGAPSGERGSVKAPGSAESP